MKYKFRINVTKGRIVSGFSRVIKAAML